MRRIEEQVLKQVVSRDGTEIAGRRVGEGPPLVLVSVRNPHASGAARTPRLAAQPVSGATLRHTH
jgi:hypothetical protein